MPTHHNELTYHLLGVPLRTGSLYPGSENDAQAYRDAHLLRCLEAAGCQVFDEGDVAIPSYLPHHHIPPIKTGLDRVLPGTVSASVSPLIYSSRGISLCLSVLTAASW